MKDLADILAKLYPDRDRVRLFLLGVGLDPDRINLDGDAILRWERVLDEAWKHQKVPEIVEAASQEYEARGAELAKAMERYRDIRSWQAGLEAAISASYRVTLPGLRYYFDRWFPPLHWALTCIGMLSMPPEWSEINEYLRELRAHIRNEFRAKTYLPLAGKPLPSISPVAQELDRDPFVSPIHQVILQIMGRSYGGDSASAQIAAASRKNRVVRNILKHLDRARDPVILLGEPGSGKTMTLQQAAMLLADRESHRIFPLVPIYVRLGEFYVEGEVDERDVWEYVKRPVPPSIQRRITELERDGRLVIFFDGMDEMSRERYGEHTEALSVFADYTLSRTLFSCRITDFSPRFLHRRLVILPFDRDQVAEYLDKYVEHSPVVIDHRPWTLKELARYIVQGELPVEANNPFVLWLLCLYLQDKKSWPDSRVEMLRYYNERNYERKNEERLADEAPFPEMERAFQEWARFAYLITERDRGLAIPVPLLQEGQDEVVVQEMIQVGKRCGVLAESRERHEEYLVRFEHHRFQEFFAALYIHENRPPINWLDRLDAPRWQETMLNLILMGEAGDVVRTFANSIVALTQTCQSKIAEIERLIEEYEPQEEEKKASEESRRESQSDQSEGQEKPEKPELVLPDEHESVLADRVEVASRIMHQVGTGAPDVHETLMPPFQEAVSLLADHGNPITQVKMMRACQNAPEADFIEALQKPLHSPITWVRNQALILIAGSQAGARAVGSDLATEIGYDLANGLFFQRLLAYVKAVHMAGNRGYWWSLLMGAFCYLTNLALLFVVSFAIYLGIWSLEKTILDFSVLRHPISIIIFGVAIATAAGTALRLRPSLLWAAIIESAFGIAVLIPAITFVWTAPWGLAESLIVISLYLIAIITLGAVLYGVAGILIAPPIHFGTLALYLAATSPIRRHGHAQTTFLIGAWRTHFEAVSTKTVRTLAVILPIGVIGYLLYLLGSLVYNTVSSPLGSFFQSIDEILHLPFPPWANAVIVVAGTILIGGFTLALILAGLKKSIAPLRSFVRALWALRYLLPLGLGVALLYMALPILVSIYYSLDLLAQSISEVSHLPFSPWANAVIVVAGTILIGGFTLALVLAGLRKSIAPLRSFGRALLRYLVVILISFILPAVALEGLLAFLHPLFVWINPPICLNCLRVVLVIIFLAIALKLFVVLWHMIKRFTFPVLQKFPPGSFDPENWKARIKAVDASTQEYLLYRTDHQSLSLTATEFLDVLKEICPMIKQEPALSTYWEQRNRLEEALKQERQG